MKQVLQLDPNLIKENYQQSGALKLLEESLLKNLEMLNEPENERLVLTFNKNNKDILNILKKQQETLDLKLTKAKPN